MNNPKKIFHSLSFVFTKNIILALLISAAVSIALYFGIQYTAFQSTPDKAAAEAKIEDALADFQEYVTENHIKTTDQSSILAWNDENWHILMRIYKNRKVVYDTILPDNLLSLPEQGLKLYDVVFEDAPAKVAIMGFFKIRNEIVLKTGCYFLALILFILIFLLLFKRKLKYINNIEEGIKIIESGSLEYKIPVQGNDELSSLAISINDMSNAMHQRSEWEASVKKERSDMMAAISHDIKTPLTSVICYLDLLTTQTYPTTEKREEYEKKAHQKAHEMKGLIDGLFEFFLAADEDVEFHYENVDGNELISQLITECIFTLEDHGFHAGWEDAVRQPYFLNADIPQIKRVFDNLYANIIKHGAKEGAISFQTELQEKFLILRQKNEISGQTAVDSFGIGLKTCKRILERHDGELTVQTEGNQFMVQIKLPVTFSIN